MGKAWLCLIRRALNHMLCAGATQTTMLWSSRWATTLLARPSNPGDTAKPRRDHSRINVAQLEDGSVDRTLE